MKTSKKILVGFTGFVMVFLITSLVVLRSDLQSLRRKADAEGRYRSVPVAIFHKIDLEGPVTLHLRQGKGYKVEWSAEEKDGRKRRLESRNGTLYLSAQAYNEDPSKEDISVRITVPTLQSIKVAKGASIHLKDFNLDSLHVQLEDGVAFTGIDNHFRKVSYATSGKVNLNLTDK